MTSASTSASRMLCATKSDPGVEQRLGVGEVEEMCGDTKPALVRLVDDRAVDLGRHLGSGAEVVVDADLDDVHFLGGDAATCFRASSGVLGSSTGPARKTRARSSAGVILLRPRRKHRRGLATKAEDGGDAIGGVGAEIGRGC